MEKTKIDQGRPYDWAKASKDYAAYRDIYPKSFYRKLIDFGIGNAGQVVLALGTGTGVLPRAMHPHGAKFHGIDINAGQIEQARILSEAQGMDIEWKTCPAEDTGYPDDKFDAVTAIQCWHYFDKKIIVPEIHRLLKKSGRLAIGFMIWLPNESAIAAASEALVLQHNPHWTGGGFDRLALEIPDWLEDRFTLETLHTYEEDLPFNYDTWRGRFRSCRGIGATLDKVEVDRFDQEHLQMLMQLTPDNFTIPHQLTIEVYRKCKM